jgi:hypothetical protein
MKKLLICLVALSLYCVAAYGQDVIVNGKVGKVIADKPVLETIYYKAVANIPNEILMGRAIVDAHRARKTESYKTEMTHEDRVATNISRLADMRAKLAVWGFKNEGDLMTQSKAADLKAGVKPEAGWQ